jgi:DNA repair protein RecO (recombination protein O)
VESGKKKLVYLFHSTFHIPHSTFRLMGIHTADAIVLRQYPFRETSAIVTCLTDRFGKIKGLIKGLRAQPARYRSPMEPLTLNRIVFYDTRTSSLHLMTQCELLAAYQALTRELDTMRLAASCAQLIDTVVELDEPQPMVFELLKRTLERLVNVGSDRWPAVRIHFVLRLLRLAGFHPQLDECTGCGQHPAGGAFWSARQGGLLCERCLHEDPNAEPIAAQWLEVLSACAEADDPCELDAGQATITQHRLDEFLRWHVDRPLKTMKK